MENESGVKSERRKGAKGLVLAAILLVAVVAGGVAAYRQGLFSMGAGKTVAMVNGAEIKERELNARWNQLRPVYAQQGVNVDDQAVVLDLKTRIVQEIINEELVVQHAENQGVSATDEEVETAYGQIQAGFENTDTFDKELKGIGLTQGDLRQNLRRELIIQKYIEQFAAQQDLSATEADIASFYENFSKGKEDVPPLADIRDQVEQEVKRQKLAERIVTLVEELKGKAEIQVLL